MKLKNLIIVVFTLALIFMGGNVLAQCSMCQAVVESSMQGEEKSFGLGLNNAILYLMAVPYVLIGIVGFMFYKKVKANANS